MTMDTGITGYKDGDEEWKKKKDEFQAYRNAGVDAPNELWDYFEADPKDLPGMIVDINGAIRTLRSHSANGYEVDLEKLPKGVKKIRFCNSW